MRLHVPHPRKAAKQRRQARHQQAARVERAVRRSGLRSRAADYEVLGQPLVVEAVDDGAWLARLLGREVAG